MGCSDDLAVVFGRASILDAASGASKNFNATAPASKEIGGGKYEWTMMRRNTVGSLALTR